ncbi:MAG: hypothetical protein E7671_04075 [Ruminococcaceae bacterium]|nr:hypothetical protein [Oscillospiraceae bacterium]
MPFLYRPLHEMNADWFWWCLHASTVSPDAFVSFWRYYHDLVTKELGIT